MTGFGPEFARSLLVDLDKEIAAVEGSILDGAADCWEAYRSLVAKRQGLRTARSLVVARLDNETRQMLGIPPSSAPRRREPIAR